MEQTGRGDGPKLVRRLEAHAPAPAFALLEATGLDPVFLRRWEEEGQMWVVGAIGDGDDGPFPAVALLVPAGARTAEVRAFAVAPGEDEAGGRLLLAMAERVCAEGILRLLAAVPTGDLARIGLLQGVGFRPTHVERGGATQERGFAGGSSDLLWLEREI